MDSGKPAGWYYVGAGQLRYRDDDGWTENYMATTDPRAAKWPPPAPESPQSYVDWVLADMEARKATESARSRRSLRRWFGRSSRST